MSSKKDIQKLLSDYCKSINDIHTEKTNLFVKNYENLFGRNNLTGHITGSAWILNETEDQVLLIHHKKLNLWLQPGGHYDTADRTIIETARRETIEETGLKSVILLSKKLFDLDVHLIPERKDIPAHYHYDFRFLFKAQDQSLNPDFAEVNAIKWVPLKQVIEDNEYQSLKQMAQKTIVL